MPPNEFSCPECPARFDTLEALQRHNLAAHMRSTRSAEPNSPRPKPE